MDIRVRRYPYKHLCGRSRSSNSLRWLNLELPIWNILLQLSGDCSVYERFCKIVGTLAARLGITTEEAEVRLFSEGRAEKDDGATTSSSTTEHELLIPSSK